MAQETRQGVGIDATGGPVIDPTKNVLDLVDAANRRQDDLREMHNRFLEAEFRRLEETVRRVEQLSELRAEFAREVSLIHQSHDREIHKMEQDKLAAFRQSDEAARLTEAARTQAAVDLVARSAETAASAIRADLSTTATALANSVAARDVELNNRVSALEKSSYEVAGKGAGTKNTVTYAIIAVGLLVSLITIGSVVVAIAFAIRR